MSKHYHVADNGYIWDKRIFRGAILCIIILFVAVGFSENWDFSYKFNYECKEAICRNPFNDCKEKISIKNIATGYDYMQQCTADWCKQTTLTKGKYGKQKSYLYSNFAYYLSAIILWAFVFNHLMHNKGKRPGLKLNVSDELWSKLKRTAKTRGEEEE